METQDQINELASRVDRNRPDATKDEDRPAADVQASSIDKLIALANLLRSAPKDSARSAEARDRVREELFRRLDES